VGDAKSSRKSSALTAGNNTSKIDRLDFKHCDIDLDGLKPSSSHWAELTRHVDRVVSGGYLDG